MPTLNCCIWPVWHQLDNAEPYLAQAVAAAPVQVTWLGYPNTTGLSTIDYRFTDARADPVGMTEALHTETLWRLPHFLCYQPMARTPPVAPSPCLGKEVCDVRVLQQFEQDHTGRREGVGRDSAPGPDSV